MTRIAALVLGKPFRYATAVGEALKIIEEENFLPDTSEVRVKFRMEFVSIKNCSDKRLDLLYRVYSTQIMPVLSAAPEARVQERELPQKASGVVDVDVAESRPFHFLPLLGYDAADKFLAGGQFKVQSKRAGAVAFLIEGAVSSQIQNVSAAMSGSSDSTSWLAHSEWFLSYSYRSLPTGVGALKDASLSAHFSAVSQPLANGNVTFRFGAGVEGGHRQSSLQGMRLGQRTVQNSPVGSMKIFAGIDSRFRHSVFSASYGLELGTAGRHVAVDWIKQLADVRHEFWRSIGDHRNLDVESRFTFGHIRVASKIPLREQFFGGSYEELFVPGESWQIRSAPMIRAIPGHRLFRTANADGSDRFLSYNLTAAYPVWRKPLVPLELSKDDEFNSLLEGQLTNATSFEQLHFLTRDPHYLKLVEFIQKPQSAPLVQTRLIDLKAKVKSAQQQHAGQFGTEFSTCLDTIDDAYSRANSGAHAKPEQQYGFVMALLSEDEDQLGEVIRSCITELNGPAALNGDRELGMGGDHLDHTRRSMESELAQIDQAAAEKNAKADMAFTRRTLRTLFHDVDIYSVSPVFVFDIARLGPRRGGFGGTRYGPGAGVRFELASTAHFTLGYAWNTAAGAGEGKGAVFFSLGLRDVFR